MLTSQARVLDHVRDPDQGKRARYPLRPQRFTGAGLLGQHQDHAQPACAADPVP